MIYAKVDPATKTVLEYPVDPKLVKDWTVANGIPTSDDIANDDLTPWGWYPVPYVAPPPLTTPDHTVTLDTPTWNGSSFERTFREVQRKAGETEQLWAKTRQRRDLLLANSDWTELPSVIASQDLSEKQAWQQYRQTLRDLTTALDPQMIEWPVPPNKYE